MESSSIKKAIETTYALFLPKGGHPFVYLSLEIEPHRVDVNVHPTKREVNFLHEDEIIELISDSIRKKLSTVDTSRSFLTQTLISRPAAIPTPTRPDSDSLAQSVNPGSAGSRKNGPAVRNQAPGELQNRKPYENNLNRVDAKTQKITTMLLANSTAGAEDDDETQLLEEPKQWQEFNYRTLKKLRSDVRDSMHNGLCEVFRNHTYVGVVDESRRLAAIQHGVKLYLVDYAAVRYVLFVLDTKTTLQTYAPSIGNSNLN